MKHSQTFDFREKRFINVGDVELCYRKSGHGPALVLFHGFPLSGRTWRKLVPGLSERFTCYAFDLVGLGDSSSGNTADFSSQGQAKVFERALFTLGVSSYALLGNDSGGWIARELALIEPERVTHLVLTNTEIPDHRPPWVRIYKWLGRVPGGKLIFRRMLASRRWRRSSMGFGGCFENLDLIDGPFDREFLAPLISSRDRLSMALRFLESMKFERMDAFRKLHKDLAMPVGFVWGAADPTFPEERARAMASQFPNVAQFRSIPKGKLFLHEEFPDAVGKAITDFLGTVAPQSPRLSSLENPVLAQS